MCGVVGIFGHQNSKELLYAAGLALQHRGQDACGISVLSRENRGLRIRTEKHLGAPTNVLVRPEVQALPRGHAYLMHLRWPTQGEARSAENLQPVWTPTTRGLIVLVANGDTPYIAEQTAFLNSRQVRLYTPNDGECLTAALAYHIVQKRRSVLESIGRLMHYSRGAFAAGLMMEFEDALYGFCDPYGIRPLILGQVDGCYCFASETIALEKIGATIIGMVNPGEVIKLNDAGLQHFQAVEAQPRKFCLIEAIYFSRPDSLCLAESDPVAFELLRQQAGAQLAAELAPWEDAYVQGVPRSGHSAAVGFQNATHLPMANILLADPKAPRTFLEAKRTALILDGKFSAIRGSRIRYIELTDDSLIEGRNLGHCTSALRQAGVEKIRVRIASPPYLWPCFYGVDTGGEHKTLMAATMTTEQICRTIGADELQFLSPAGVQKAYGNGGWCDACFSGNYPVPIPAHLMAAFRARHQPQPQ
ncbi:hypothetical protein HY933_02100 [Candidatus Falkowbacteria bacterium]|nr:hypothetical protein [Candidatus Falkowbacteria bacterium]